LNEEELANTDYVEITKISQFYKMVYGLKNIAVMLSKKEGSTIENIEKWPLI